MRRISTHLVFFKQVFERCNKNSANRIFIGDFNLVLNIELDKKNRTSNNKNAASYVNDFMNANTLLMCGECATQRPKDSPGTEPNHS